MKGGEKILLTIADLKDWSKPPNLLTELRIILCAVPAIILLYGDVNIVKDFVNWTVSMIRTEQLVDYLVNQNVFKPMDSYLVNQKIVAMIIFVIAASTDKLDGIIARKFNMITRLGTVMDPIVDKFLILFTLIGLSVLYWPLWIPTVIIATREIYVAIMLNYYRKKGYEVSVVNSGKVKMVVQSVAITVLFLPLKGEWQFIIWSLIVVALYLTISSGYDYVRAFNDVTDHDNNKR